MMLAINRCRWVRRRLALLAGDLDGRDLRPDDRRFVERHLLGCVTCRAERNSLATAVGMLQAISTVPSTTPGAPSIWPGVSHQIDRSRHPRHGFFSGMGTGPAIGLAASLVGIGTAIGLIGWNLGSASATRSRFEQARVEPIPPRPALPPAAPQIADGQTLPKPATQITLEPAPKTSLTSNSSDPQKSQ